MKHTRLWEVLCEVVVLHITIRLKVLGNVCYSKKKEKLLQMNPGDFSPGCPKLGESKRDQIGVQHPQPAGGRTGDPQGRGSSQLLLFSWYVIMAEFLSVFFYHLVSFIHVILLVLLGSGEE